LTADPIPEISEIPDFPFPDRPGVRAPEQYARLLTEPSLPRVLLSSGVEALLVTRYADVKAVLSDDRFSRESFRGKPMFARSPESLALAVSDPPVHTRRRQAVIQSFTARQARQQAPRLRELAARALDGLAGLPQPADLVEGFTIPFALGVIAEMLGVAFDDAQRLRPLMSTMMSVSRYSPEEVAAAHKSAQGYFSDLVALREAEIDQGRPGTDVLSQLLSAPVEERLSRQEIVVFGSGSLMAGFETTANQLAMCVLMILDRPGLTDRLRGDQTALERAVEEMLRWSSLLRTGGAAHVALEDVRLGDELVRAGQVVVPLTDAANQDGSVFEHPELFTPDREHNPHVAFGHGRHLCLGAPLARAELQIGLAALLERFADLRIAEPPGGLRWREGMFIRGLRELPVHWDDRSADAGSDPRARLAST
jgi:cytochrome P450